MVALGGPRQRSVLAILLLHANQVVPSERLVDLIWGESAPPTAATALQGYVSQLRKVIEPDRTAPSVIVTKGPGYVALVAPGQLDVSRFEQLVSHGRTELAAGRPQEAADAFAEALALWRGPALANVRNEAFASEPIRRLEESRIAAVEDHLDARLALGRHGEAVAELEALVAEHPLRERLRGQLMLALYRSGRQAEALEAFGAGRRMLVDELGIEPGKPLRVLHQRILEQDPSLAAPEPGPADRPLPPPRRHRRRALAAVLAAGAIAVAVALVAIGGDDGPTAAPGPAANSLVLLDAESGRLQATIDVGGTPTSVAVGEGATWVLNADDQTITRVDERTRAVKTFGSGGVPTDLAAGAGALWVGNGKRTRAQFIGPVATSIVRVDPSTTAVRAAVTLPDPGGFTSNIQQDHIAVTRDAVWAVNPDASVSRVDPRADEVSAVVRRLDAGAVAAGDEGVWALSLDSQLARIDPGTASVDKRIRVAANTLSAIAVGAGAVWAAAPYDGTVWRVDPEPRLVQRTIDVGTGVTDVAYGLGSVWALNSLRGTVSRIDPETNRVVWQGPPREHPAPDRGRGRGRVGDRRRRRRRSGGGRRRGAERRSGAPCRDLRTRVLRRQRRARSADRVRHAAAGRRRAADAPDERGDRPRVAPARLPRRAPAHRLPVVRRFDGAGGDLRRGQVRGQRQAVRGDARGDRRDRPVQLGLRVRADPDRQPCRAAR